MTLDFRCDITIPAPERRFICSSKVIYRNLEVTHHVHLHLSLIHIFQAEHRGRGYAAEALALLEYQAFEVDGIHMLHNEFETGRAAACRAHLSAGFSEYRRENGLIELLLTREQYFARQSRQRE